MKLLSVALQESKPLCGGVVFVAPGKMTISNIVQILHLFIFRLIEHMFHCRKARVISTFV
jgi:hypothetical protein